jgi:hypothetical protein
MIKLIINFICNAKWLKNGKLRANSAQHPPPPQKKSARTPMLAQLMVNNKRNAREEWLRIILRTREKTADLLKQIDENKTFLSVNEISSQNVF